MVEDNKGNKSKREIPSYRNNEYNLSLKQNCVKCSGKKNKAITILFMQLIKVWKNITCCFIRDKSFKIC